MPLTVQMEGVSEAKLTVRPEVAVAERFTLVAAALPPGMGVKVMVWDACPMPKVWLTGEAGEYKPLPACVAWIVQEP